MTSGLGAKGDTRAKVMVVSAILTVILAWTTFQVAQLIYQRTNAPESLSRGPGMLLIPMLIQVGWWIAGTIYSRSQKRREVLTGILVGFGLEAAALITLVLISASAHY